MFIAAVASAGVPGFAGFFSKDAIIEAVGFANIPGVEFAYFCVLATVFVTALYTFRLIFMTFHGQPRMDAHTKEHLHESPWVVTFPLIILAIPTIGAGWFIGPIVFGSYFDGAIHVLPQHDAISQLGAEFTGVFGMMTHALSTAPFWLSVAGIFTAWYLYIVRTDLPEKIKQRMLPIYTLLDRKYYIDEFYSWLFAGGSRALSSVLWKYGDVKIIDGFFVNGTARVIAWTAMLVRRFQTGYIYHYAFSMIVGVFILITLWLYQT
jgi:NADH-quinone oxidoreductase subunit L